MTRFEAVSAAVGRWTVRDTEDGRRMVALIFPVPDKTGAARWYAKRFAEMLNRIAEERTNGNQD